MTHDQQTLAQHYIYFALLPKKHHPKTSTLHPRHHHHKTMSATPTFPPLTPSHYTWTLSNTPTPSTWHRPALAGETMWAHRASEYHQIYLHASLTLLHPITQPDLISTARDAWVQLRRENPELGVIARVGEDGKVVMEARGGEVDAEAWLRGSFSLFFNRSEDVDEDGDGFEGMKREMGVGCKEGRNATQAALLLKLQETEDASVKKVDLMMNADHQITDGIGVRILLSKYLSILATSIEKLPTANPSQNPTTSDWNNNDDRPTEPWICLLDTNQVLSGPEYEEAVRQNTEILLSKMGANIGLRLLQTQNPATQEHHSITLPLVQSQKLLETIKSTFASQTNITHLAHAAMVLSLLQNTKSSAENGTLYSPCWINGRRYIRSQNPDTDVLPTRTYIPICQSFAPIIFPNLQNLLLPPIWSSEEVRSKLLSACNTATAQYTLLKERKSIMPESVVLMEYLGQCMYQKTKALSEETTTRKLGAEADPFLLSDGIIEDYIAHRYGTAFEVDKVRFAANAEGPNLIVRLSYWRGRIEVAGEWRGCDYGREEAVTFLEDVVVIMCCVIPEM